MLVASAIAPPLWARYHRHLAGGDFSLEANTETTPQTGAFYVIQCGSVLLRSSDFPTAEAAYGGLCEEHWTRHLTSSDPAQRLASAWGLLGMEPANRAAAAVIEQDGLPGDHLRLARARSRRRALLKHAAKRAKLNRP